MNQFQEMLVKYFDVRLKETANDARCRQEVLEEKAAAIRAADSPDARKLLNLEAQLAQAEQRCAHLSRAVDEGQLAYATTYDILNDLNMLSFPALPGTGKNRMPHVYELIKSIHAQDVRLQMELKRFRAELVETGLQFDAGAEVGQLIRGERALMDMLFTWEEIMGKAAYAAERFGVFLEALQPVLHQLEHMRRKACDEHETLCIQRNTLIEQSRIFGSND